VRRGEVLGIAGLMERRSGPLMAFGALQVASQEFRNLAGPVTGWAGRNGHQKVGPSGSHQACDAEYFAAAHRS